MRKAPWTGFFLVLEGIDGSGKTTVAQNLCSFFEKHDITVVQTAEPSQGQIGRIIRNNLQDNTIHPAVDALLFAADRLEHGFNEILPALNDGKIVISDRYIDSSLVYQTIQGSEAGLTFDWIQNLNKFSLIPDRIYLLDIEAQDSLARRKQHNNVSDVEMEKFETLSFQQKIRILFLEIAQQNLDKNHVIVDATKSLKEITDEIIKDLRTLPYFSKKKLL